VETILSQFHPVPILTTHLPKIHLNIILHVMWIHGHYSMTCPSVGGGADGFHVWRVGVNIQNERPNSQQVVFFQLEGWA
jgi:hypothetical protein